jgi:DNA-binding NtrC family response regulator
MGIVKTILIVEDEPSVLNLFRVVPLQAGYLVIEAICAEQAIQQSREASENICLIIADVTRPSSSIQSSIQLKGVDTSFANYVRLRVMDPRYLG